MHRRDHDLRRHSRGSGQGGAGAGRFDRDVDASERAFQRRSRKAAAWHLKGPGPGWDDDLDALGADDEDDIGTPDTWATRN